MHASAAAGADACLAILLEKGARAGDVDEQARTPLHLAASGGHVECAKVGALDMCDQSQLSASYLLCVTCLCSSERCTR